MHGAFEEAIVDAKSRSSKTWGGAGCASHSMNRVHGTHVSPNFIGLAAKMLRNNDLEDFRETYVTCGGYFLHRMGRDAYNPGS